MSRGVLASGPATDGLVIVGAGVAGLRVAQSVRHEGYTGPITMVGAERHLPYDRPPLSKQVLRGELAASATEYHPASYFDDELGATMLLGRQASSVDRDRRELSLADGERIAYDALVVATGSRPRQLPFATPAEGVHVLRTRDDALALRADLGRANRLAVVGAGLVGVEVASTAVSMGLEVVIVETAPVPLVRVIGPTVGGDLATLHEAAGVKLRCGTAVTGFTGREHVEGITLDDGSILDVDLVVAAVGVVPDVEWLECVGLDLSDGLACDDRLSTPDPRIFGAGDAVSYPSARFGGRVRSQQWTTASDQGRFVGRVLVHGPDAVPPFDSDLYFWSDHYGVRVQGAGERRGRCVVLARSVATRSYLAAFRDDDRITGVIGMNDPKGFAALRKLARASAAWTEVEAFRRDLPAQLVTANE